MKLRYIIYALLLSSMHTCLSSIKIQMPSQDILNQKLTDIGLSFLVDNRLLVKEIANQEIFLDTLIIRVHFALDNYITDVLRKAEDPTILNKKPIILASFVNHNLDAISKLYDLGTLNKVTP